LLGGCSVGDAKLTKGYNLPAKFVIHTVGPVWNGGNAGEMEQLTSCYRRCLQIARENRFTSIAFPAISTGVYGYPIENATKIAVHTILAFLKGANSSLDVTFCCFSQRDLSVYEKCVSVRDLKFLAMYRNPVFRDFVRSLIDA